MAVDLKFSGTVSSQTNEHKLVAYSNTNNEIYVCIDMGGVFQDSFICLDRQTAIRLVRELKKQIGFLESEVSNG